MATKVSDVKNLVKLGIIEPNEAFPKIKQLAQSNDWKVREVAATCLVEVSKRRTTEVIQEMLHWADDNLYIKRSVANVLRNASRYDPRFVFELCKKWALFGNPNTNWIIKDGIRKLPPEQQQETMSLLKRA